MRKFALAFAVLVCAGAPALAGSTAPAAADKPMVLAQTTVVTRDRGPSVTIHTRDRHRHVDRHHHRQWMARDRGCRTTTIRERRGDRVIVKKIRRC